MKATKGGKAHFEIRDHYKAIERLRQGLKDAILACPGPSKASGIKTLGPRCCTVSSASLFGGVMAADSYIFPVQYEALGKMIEVGSPATAVKRLLKSLGKGWVVVNADHRIRLHPEVVQNVRNMLKEAV
jgi:hypothetical protein